MRVMDRVPFAFVAVFCALFYSCAASPSQKPGKSSGPRMPKSETYKTLAQQKLGEGTDYLFNADRSRVICLQKMKKTATRAIPALRFFVYDLKSGKIIFEDAPGNASIRWAGAGKIEVRLVPGIVRGDVDERAQMRGYIYDLDLRKKTKRGVLAR